MNATASVVDRATRAYIETALWASCGEDGMSFDSAGYGPDDCHESMVCACESDVRDFIESNGADIEASGLSPEQVGHNFFLTRNRHGAGFWDLGLGEPGANLTNAAHAYGSHDLYLSDDGIICD